MTPFKAVIVPVTPLQQNCTVLWDDTTKQGAVVDPGGDVPLILQAIAAQGVQVERILLTHGHLDHAGGAAALRDALGVPVWGPDERDGFLLDGLEEAGRAYGIGGMRNVQPDRWLAEGDTVTVGAVPFAVLHCPGHTPGHLAFLQAEARFALVGDVLFRGSVGRTDFPYGDSSALLRSIRDKLMPLDDRTAFLCGHGPGSTIGLERASNPFVRQALAMPGGA